MSQQRDAEQRADRVADQPRHQAGADARRETRPAIEATSRPPQLPRRLRPSAVASTGTRHSSFADISPSRADAVGAIAELDADRVPAAVFLSARRIAEVVLLAQLVGDAGGRRIEIARIADDLGAAAAVVGHVAQRHDVDAIVVQTAASTSAAAPATAPRRAAGAGRSAACRRTDRAPGKRHVATAPEPAARGGGWRDGRFAFAVDPDRVDQHFGLANLRLELADRRSRSTCRCRPRSRAAPSSGSVPAGSAESPRRRRRTSPCRRSARCVRARATAAGDPWSTPAAAPACC